MKNKVLVPVSLSTIFFKTLLMVFFLIFSSSNKSFAQSGAALNFDGADDFVQVGNILPSTYTKEAWVYVSNLGLNNNFISGGSDGQHALYAPAVYGNRLSAGHNGIWNQVQDPDPIVANTWYNVALTYDVATTTMKLYKNGILVATNTGVVPFTGGNTLRLGCYDALQNLLGGKIDEVRIWNRVLSQTEIQNKINCELVAGQTGLIAYYKFNQGINNANNSTITTLTDSSGNNNTGTLNNFSLNGTISNWVAGGGVLTGNSCPTNVTTNGGSGLALAYATLEDAINALNLATITSPVIITLTGDETAPAGGYQITAQGTATNTITIQGNISIITANNLQIVGSRTDAIFKLIGADYITLQNFTMQENGANTVNTLASNTKTEFGVGLFFASTTNGSQNNTIQNNIISLDRLYQNSFGIYSNVNHTATNGITTVNITALSGSNSNNKFYNNTINNVNNGFTLIGSGVAAYMDENNEIGGSTTVLGNNLTNWGSNTVSDAGYIYNPSTIQGIYINHQRGYIATNNILISANAINTANFRGIFQNYSSIAPTGTFTNTITNNQITLNALNANTAFQHIAITNGVSTAILNVTNNTMLNSVVSGVSANTTMIGVFNNSSYGSININNNTIKNWTSTATTGGFTGFIHSSGIFTSLNINNNKIGESTTPAITYSVATSGIITGIANNFAVTTGTVTISNNDFRGIVQSNVGTGAHNYIQNNIVVANLIVSDNTFTNISANTSGAITFISHNYSIPANGTQTFNNNNIVTGFNKTTTGGSITVFNATGTSPIGTTTTYTNNNFSNITITGTVNIAGINNLNGTGTSGSTRIVTGNTFSNWTGANGTRTGILLNHIGANSTISNNTISNFNTSSTSPLYGINIGNSYAGSNPLNINNNSISQLISTGSDVIAISTVNNSASINVLNNIISDLQGVGLNVRGLHILNGLNTTISKNKITNLEGKATNSVVNGMATQGSPNSIFNVTNNFIGNLTHPIANNTSDAIVGINASVAITNFTLNVYNNTIYLNATSTGTNFSTAAIYHVSNSTATTTTLDMRNNIFVNNSIANGTGKTVAIRRNNNILTNFASTSNNNNFVAPIVFGDGLSFDTTLEAYKTKVTPRETNSVSESVNFLSINPVDATYLHVNSAIPTPLESRSIPIVSVVTDFDSDIRQGQAGYTGTGTAPDLGADEFEGTICSLKPIAVATIIYIQNAIATPLTATGINLLWYTTATGGTGTAIAPTPSTTTLGTTSYWITQTSTNGCESQRFKIDVVVNLIGTHLNFNATTDYVNITGGGIASVIDPINTFTVEAWVYPTAISNGLGNNFGMIVGNYNTGVNSMQFMLRKESGTDYAFWVNTGAGYQAVGAVNSLTLNAWQHIAGVWDGSEIKIYINGILMNTTTGVTGTSFATVNNPIRIGLNNSNEKFVGNIDEVRIWTRALTQAEIMNKMNCELAAGQTNLLAYYKFNQGFSAVNNSTITTLTDSSGNNYNGILNGFALNGTTSNWLAGSPIYTDVAPTAVAQNFCNAATVSNLLPTPSSSIKWYNVATGGIALLPSTILTTGTYYVCAVNPNGCESTRTSVAITIADTTEWNGAWTNGLPISGKKVIISANYSGVGFAACTLDVIGTAIVVIPSNETLNIDGIVNVAPTASLTFSNNANLVQSQNVTNIGNITSLRDSSPVIRLDYVAWSSPVLNQNLLSFSPATLTNRFYRYEPSGTTTATSWIAIDPTTTSFTPAKGNLIRTPNTWSSTIYSAYSGSFTGIPNNGNYTPAVTLGYNLLGNPYPSPLSGNTFIGNNTAIGATTLYFWTHVIPATAGTYAQNNYASYTTAGGVAAAAGGAQPNGTIQVGQGFFTNATTAGNAIFNNAQRVTSSTGQFFRTNQSEEKHRLWLDLTSPNNLHNQMMVAYMSGASNTIDNSDGKLFGNTNSVIYNALESDKYVIQGKALPFTDTDFVPVGFMAANAGEFTITLSQFDGLFTNQDVYLKDNVLNLTHNIKNSAYTFMSNEGEFNNRFEIVYLPLVLSNPTIELNENSVIVYKNNTSLEINSGNTIIFEVNVFDMRGRKIVSKSNIHATSTRFENLNIQQEVLLVEVINSNGTKVIKKIIF